MLTLLAAFVACLLVGQILVGALVLFTGAIGFRVVFDPRRSWWPPELRTTPVRPPPDVERRINIVLMVVLVAITIVIGYVLWVR